MKLTVVVLLSMLSFVASQLSVEKVKPHPEHPNACYVEEEKKAYPVGSTWSQANECVQKKCGENNGELFIYHSGCGLVSAQPPCQVFTDESAKFPDCCPKIACP